MTGRVTCLSHLERRVGRATISRPKQTATPGNGIGTALQHLRILALPARWEPSSRPLRATRCASARWRLPTLRRFFLTLRRATDPQNRPQSRQFLFCVPRNEDILQKRPGNTLSISFCACVCLKRLRRFSTGCVSQQTLYSIQVKLLSLSLVSDRLWQS